MVREIWRLLEDGRVYSGHSKSGDFVSKIKEGYKVWVENECVLFNTRQHRSVDGENCWRGTDELIVYKNNVVKRNICGCEVAILNGVAINTPVYMGSTTSTFPKRICHIWTWCLLTVDVEKYQKGTKVTYDGNVITVG